MATARHAADRRLRARVVLCVAAAVALCVAGGGGAAARAAPKPAGVAWGDQHFTSQKALGSWLSARGIDYGAWALRHPSGAYLMTHAAPARPRATRRAAAEPVYVDRGYHASSDGSGASNIVLPLVALLFAIGVVPFRRLVAPRGVVAAAVVARALEIRFAAFACAAALLLGLLVTQVLS